MGALSGMALSTIVKTLGSPGAKALVLGAASTVGVTLAGDELIARLTTAATGQDAQTTFGKWIESLRGNGSTVTLETLRPDLEKRLFSLLRRTGMTMNDIALLQEIIDDKQAIEGYIARGLTS